VWANGDSFFNRCPMRVRNFPDTPARVVWPIISNESECVRISISKFIVRARQWPWSDLLAGQVTTRWVARIEPRSEV